jgi:hypothetical protein
MTGNECAGTPSPHRGEGGGEGVTIIGMIERSGPPHPNPLSKGEREPIASVAQP